jgi:hypothetical protein
MAEPFALSKHLAFGSEQSQLIVNFDPVPDDRRLVIESVSAVSASPGIPDRESLTAITLLFKTNDEIISWPIPVAALLRNRPAFEGPGWVLEVYRNSATANVRLYADPGSLLQLVALRTRFINPLGLDFALSGYLLSPASPRLGP